MTIKTRDIRCVPFSAILTVFKFKSYILNEDMMINKYLSSFQQHNDEQLLKNLKLLLIYYFDYRFRPSMITV